MDQHDQSVFSDRNFQESLRSFALFVENQERNRQPVDRVREDVNSVFGDANFVEQAGNFAEMANNSQSVERVRESSDSVYTDQRFLQEAQGLSELVNAQRQATQAILAKNTLNGGEISLELAGRFDQQRYISGAYHLRNFVVMPTGGICKRPGFTRLGQALSADTLLQPFIFSASQSRIMEFYIKANGKTGLRLWSVDGHVFETSLELPFTRNNLKNTNFCQSADVLFYANPDLPPGKIMRYADTDWRHEKIKWIPTIKAPIPQVLRQEGTPTEGETRRVNCYYVVTAIDKDTGEESPPSTKCYLTGAFPPTTSYPIKIPVLPVENAMEYRFYKLEAGVYGFIGRVNADEDILEFVDTGYTADTEDTPPEAKNPFDGVNNYPSVVFLHQQRLGYAASNARPMTIWLSQSGNFESMAASIPPEDDDAIEVTLAANQANKILWAITEGDGLSVGTEGGEWMLQSSEEAAITPTDLTFKPQTNYGSEKGLQPVKCNSGVIFCQRGGHVVRELGYSFQDDRYNALNLSLLSSHMLKENRIIKWTWQQEPYGILWCLNDKGSLFALTYLKEHDVCAWSRHDTQCSIKDIAAIPNNDGQWVLFLHAQDSEKNLHILKMANFGEKFTDDIGGSYTATLMPCIPETSAETFQLLRKINAVKFRVLNSGTFQCRPVGGSTESEWIDVPANNDLDKASNIGCGNGYSNDRIADWACAISSGFRENIGIEIQSRTDAPLNLLGITFNMEYSTNINSQI